MIKSQVINWDYIVRLQTLQDEECIRAGNKLSAQHIDYDSNKMKVKLASQVFSRSVAAALQTCQDLELDGFDGVGPTINFIKDMDW